MAFIKTYFLKYFISGLLTNSIGNTNKMNIYINRARRASIKILGVFSDKLHPRINSVYIPIISSYII